MAEKLNRDLHKIILHLPFPLLRAAKKAYRHPRYYLALKQGRKNCCRYGQQYKHNVLFVAGLPKSGTTWLENMLGSFPGYTIIPDPAITVHDYKHGGTHDYDIDFNYLDDLRDALALVKVHAHASQDNLNLLHERGIPYCIMYRDLRDAAVSYVHYVKRTPWHPEYPHYKNIDIHDGLIRFGGSLLPQWRDWVQGWTDRRDPVRSHVIKYEDLLKDSENEFLKVTDFFELPKDNVKEIVRHNRFSNMQKKGSFFRKGASGDWRIHFDGELRDLYKAQIGGFLVEHGYERDENW